MKRIALCIGNDAYSILPALNCAIADATAMEKELKDLGFDTELRTDLDRTGLADAIFSFADKIENYDAALIYYAGHGFQVDGDNILAPIELDIQARPELVKYNAFPFCLKYAMIHLHLQANHPENDLLFAYANCQSCPIK